MKPDEHVVCRGCWELGNNCGRCSKCVATRPAPPPLMKWMLCCNDAHGNFEGKVSLATFDLAGSLVELEGPGVRIRFTDPCESPVFRGVYRQAKEYLKVYRKGRLPVFRRDRMVGNVYWDCVGLPVAHGVALCNWLRQLGWGMDAGPARLMEVWGRDDPHAVTQEELAWEDRG